MQNFKEIADKTGYQLSTIEKLHNEGMLKGFLDMVYADMRNKKEQQAIINKKIC